MTAQTLGGSTARVATERPARYAKQLVSHFGQHSTGHWSDEDQRGDITFVGEGVGAENHKRAFDGTVHVSLVAAEAMLLIHLEGPEELIERFENIVGSHLVRFGTKDELEVSWRRASGDGGSQQSSC